MICRCFKSFERSIVLSSEHCFCFLWSLLLTEYKRKRSRILKLVYLNSVEMFTANLVCDLSADKVREINFCVPFQV